MTKLLNKECRLAASPLSYIFIAGSFMTMIPGYPFLVGAFFVCLGIFYSFQNARECGDIYYSVLLPVKKTDIVRAKYTFTATIQIISFIIISVLTALRMTVLADAAAYKTNPLMNLSPVALALVLILFSFFNTVFLGMHFRTAWKIGIPFLVFTVTAMVLVAAAEALRHIPALSFLNSTRGEKLPLQFAILAVCAAVYTISITVSCRISEKRFEKIDL